MGADLELSNIVAMSATVTALVALASRRLQPAPLGTAAFAVLTYSAGVAFLVAACCTRALFAKATTGLLGKRANGSIAPYSWVLLFPYHLGLRVKNIVQRSLSSEPLFNKILPGWYLGGWPRSPAELPAEGCSVLDCTCELPRAHRNRYCCLHIWDTQAPHAALVERGVAFALAERSLGKPVFVHCAHGHGRSALLLIACLLESGVVSSVDEGLALLQAARPKVHLNSWQRAALDAWVSSRKSQALQMHALGGAHSAAGAGGAASNGAGGAVANASGAVHVHADANRRTTSGQQRT